jgi:hypothetical protein
MLTSIAPSLRESDVGRGGSRWIPIALTAGWRVPVIAALAVITLLAGCRGEAEEEAPVYSEPEYEGLSLEEIQSQAEPMTPEEAERLGIVDTTIRIESPIHPDSVPLLEAQPIEPGAQPTDPAP